MSTKLEKMELMQYLGVLQGLKDSGIKCEQEISKAIKALDRLMFPKQQRFDILVLENSEVGVSNSVHVYKTLLKVDHSMGDHRDRSVYDGETRVRIIDVGKVDTEKLRGLEVDAIINNVRSASDTTLFDVTADMDNLGIRIKKN